MTLNDLESCSSPYLAFSSRNSTDFQDNYITVVEDRPIMSVKILSPSSSFLLFAKTIMQRQRGLYALAEHLIKDVTCVPTVIV